MNKLVFNSPNLFSSGLRKDEWLSPFDKMLDEMLSASNPELHKVFGDSVFEKSLSSAISFFVAISSSI